MGAAEPGGGRGRGQSQATPTAPDRTRNSSRTEAGETEERDTYRESATHSQKGEGDTHTWVWNTPHTHTYKRAVGRRQPIKSSSSLQSPDSCLLSSHLLASSTPRPPNLPLFSLQSLKKGCWTDAPPRDPILPWWKVAGAASKWRQRPAGSEGCTGVLRPRTRASGSHGLRHSPSLASSHNPGSFSCPSPASPPAPWA